MQSPRKWAQWIIGVSLTTFALFIVFWPVYDRAIKNKRPNSCQSNLKQIGLGYKQYVQDYDELSPPISGAADQGWADLVQPYLKSWFVFQCPSAQTSPDQRSSDYFYNANMSQAKVPAASWQIILLGEGYDNSGTNAHLSELPLDWKNDANSPANRHPFGEVGGANYAFADGHVKWYKSQKMGELQFREAKKPRAKIPTPKRR